MAAANEANPFDRLVQMIAPGSTLRRAWPLQGGVSAQVTALEIEQPDGRTRRLVVRRHGALDLEHNPQIAADEFKLLRLLQSAGVAVPTPYHVDPLGQIFATPSLVLEYIEGAPPSAPTDLPDLTHQLARHLSSIHALDCSSLDLLFLPAQAARAAATLRARPATVDESLDEGHIRDTLEAVWPLPQRNRSVLLHGDFWPGNTLWKDGRLVAVIDWEDAAVGDPLADLANARLEILWAFGAEAMRAFTDQYRSLAPIDLTNLPGWDLWAALRPIAKIAGWGLDQTTEATSRERHRWFVRQACDRLHDKE